MTLRLLPALSAVLLATPAQIVRADGPLTVFAAASLQEVMAEAADGWQATLTGRVPRLRFVFAASSTLARQISAGAPADLFISAHPRWMIWLGKALSRRTDMRLCGRRAVLSNRLVLITPAGHSRPPRNIWRRGRLRAALRDGRLALGDPDHVPAGLYARDALRRLGLWAGLRSRLARAASTRAALALVARQETAFGIVYRSDARAEPRVRVAATLPRLAQPEIRYEAVAVVRGGQRCGGTASAVGRFLMWFGEAAARGRFARFGFDPPPVGKDPKR